MIKWNINCLVSSRFIGKEKYVLNLMTTLKPHIEWGKSLNMFWASLQGLSTHMMTLMLCYPEAGQVSFIRMVLLIFEVILGLSVNWRRIYIFPIKEMVQMEELAGILGWKIE